MVGNNMCCRSSAIASSSAGTPPNTSSAPSGTGSVVKKQGAVKRLPEVMGSTSCLWRRAS